MEFLVDAILELKNRYKDPFICVAGDFNSHDIQSYLDDYPDLSLLVTGPTRNEKTIDIIFTNFPSQIVESGTISPLESDSGGSASNHRVVYCTAELKRFQAYEWITYFYIRQTEEGNALFKEYLNEQIWSDVFNACDSDSKAVVYQTIVDERMKKCYPLLSVKKKSTDDPWITEKIRKKIRQRKNI